MERLYGSVRVRDQRDHVGNRARGGRRRRGGLRGASRRDPDLFESQRRLPVARRKLHHNMILIEGIVDRAHLPLTECIVERGIDGRFVQTESCSRGAIDH